MRLEESVESGNVRVSTDEMCVVVARTLKFHEFLGAPQFRDTTTHIDGCDPIIRTMKHE